MRVVLKIESRKNSSIPVNYNYPLSSAIYNLLRLGSSEFSSFLHDIGFKQNNKIYKLFTFALRFENAYIKGNSFILKSPNALLYISSPLIDTFIQTFIIGTFESQSIEIIDKNHNALFQITQVETLPEIKFKDVADFIPYSPIVLSVKRETGNQFRQYYLRPEDTDEINRVMTNNLLAKYQLINQKTIEGGNVKLEWDKDYLKTHTRLTKKITVNKDENISIDIIGMQAPFTLTGNSELIKVGYDVGFGEKNSMGFGLAVSRN